DGEGESRGELKLRPPPTAHIFPQRCPARYSSTMRIRQLMAPPEEERKGRTGFRSPDACWLHDRVPPTRSHAEGRSGPVGWQPFSPDQWVHDLCGGVIIYAGI